MSNSEENEKKNEIENDQNENKNTKCKSEGQKHGSKLIVVIDQDSSSSNVLVIDREMAKIVTQHRIELKQIHPHEGWIELDANDIYESVLKCIEEVTSKLKEKNQIDDIEYMAITNQRETTIIWDSNTGNPLYNAILWNDNRTTMLMEQILQRIPSRDKYWFKSKTGLIISPYFSAMKIKWIIDNVCQVKKAIINGNAKFGTVDSWLLYKLTGNHLTDVTNASRTMLMNIRTLQWEKSICDFFKIPLQMLPKIMPSSSNFGLLKEGPLKNLQITGVIGNKQASLIGIKCIKVGNINISFGSGAFLMQNIGSSLDQQSASNNLLQTIAYKMGQDPPCYALEGPTPIAGTAIKWLSDKLELIKNLDEVKEIAEKEISSSGVYLVPAFEGLYAPHWDNTATGLLIGLTQYSQKSHLIRATLESIAFQINDILELIHNRKDIQSLQIEGSMTTNSLFCQILSNKTGIEINRSLETSSQAYGAAIVASFYHGHWKQLFNNLPTKFDSFKTTIDSKIRAEQLVLWKNAVKRSQNWNVMKSESSIAKKKLSLIGRFIKKLIKKE